MSVKTNNLGTKTESEKNLRKKLVFNLCPVCGSGELIEFGVDTLCCHCDWDSCKQYVDEGLMDNRLLAFKELFDPRNKPMLKRNLKAKKPTNIDSKKDEKKKTRSNLSVDQTHEQFFQKLKNVANY